MSRPVRVVLAVSLLVAGAVAQADRVGADELPSGPDNRDDVVIRVGDREIRQSDVYLDVDLAAPSLVEEIVRQRVFDVVVRAEAAEHGIDVPRAELETAFERAIAAQREQFERANGGVMTLEEYFDGRHGIDADEHRELVRRRVLSNLLLDRVVRFDQLSFARVECQLILVEDYDLALELRDKVDAGASFSVLATRHSVHPSATAGGMFPMLPASVDVPLLEGRASMAPGEVSGPDAITLEERPFWRLLRLVDRHEARDVTWPEVAEEIEASLARKGLSADELTVFEERMIDRYRIELAAR